MSPRGKGTAASPLSFPISIRAYAIEWDPEKAANDNRPAEEGGKRNRQRQTLDEPSHWSFVFDTETTIDPSQRFRVGFYRTYLGNRLDEERLFLDAGALKASEVETAEQYCRAKRLPPPISLEAFRVELLKSISRGAMIVTFNGPFDFARIAISATPARATAWRRKMQGGFSFKLSEDDHQPAIQVKALNSSAAVVELTAPRKQETGRSQRKKRAETPTHRGFFTDVKTLAKSLLSRLHSLETLTEALGTKTQKHGSQRHGFDLDFDYLNYARDDVAATWECYEALKRKYASYGLTAKPVQSILSEASIGKAALETMGVKPWAKVDPNAADPGLISLIMSTYYGGRTEVRLRRTEARVVHTDFTSMYPSVCTAQGLWRFIIAKGFTYRRGSAATAEIRQLLETATPETFQDLTSWPKLAALVRVKPEFDLFPIRAPFGSAHPSGVISSGSRKKKSPPSLNIGLNFLKADRALWYTLADCLAAKFLSGKTPGIEEAVIFEPDEPQEGLRPIKLLGRRWIDPYKQDFFRELIRARQAEEAAKEGKSKTEQAKLEEVREGLKTVANATSYGIYVQVNVNREPKKAWVRVYKPDGTFYLKRMAKVEEIGPWFNPLVATLITGGARLMLALAEYRVIQAGLDWAFCDTDSIAIAMPPDLDPSNTEHCRIFEDRADGVVEWFRPLNPYGLDDPLLKVEKVNHPPGEKSGFEPLYCWAISSKRYALYNKDKTGRAVIRKASAHGLGHLWEPYKDDEAPGCFPGPLDKVLGGKEKLKRWQYDVWCAILEAVRSGEPDFVEFDYHPGLKEPTASRYTASSPELLKWFKLWNDKRPEYADQVKPFNFLFSLHKRSRSRIGDDIPDPIEGASEEGEIRPVAPFEKNLADAVRQAFDRIGGKAISTSQLQTYEEALVEYPFRNEAKFLNGEGFDAGRTERCYVLATETRYIGKEADRWEEEYYLGVRNGELAIDYGGDPLKGGQAFVMIRNAIAAFGKSNVATVTGISRGTLSKMERGKAATTNVPLDRIISAIRELNRGRTAERQKADAERASTKELVLKHGGVRKAAQAVGVDASNLSKKLNGRR